MKSEIISRLKKYGNVNETVIHTEPRLHSGHMEVAVAKLIGYRRNTIVPNVSWGLGLRHECDMLVLDDKNRFTEIEIKISKQDFKKDFEKAHGHASGIISRLVYAVPEKLSQYCIETISGLCRSDIGIIKVSWCGYLGMYRAEWVMIPKHRKLYQPVPEKTIKKFMSLGCMRIWSLKEKNNKRS